MKPFPGFQASLSSMSFLPASSRPCRRWIASRLRQMWEVLHSPVSAFARNPDGPGYLVPLVVLSLISMVLAVIQSPIQLEWMSAQLFAAGAAPAQVADGFDLMRRSVRAGVIVVPLLLTIRWLTHALLLWLTAQLFLISIGFSQTLTVVAYSYVPILLRDVAACLVLCLRDSDVLIQAEGLNVAFGLNLLFPRIPAPWWALAANVNLFEAWFVILLVGGLCAMTRLRWQKLAVVALLVWGFTTLLQFGLVTLGYLLRSQFVRG